MYLSGLLSPIAASKSMLYYGSDLEREEMRQNKVTGGVGERDTGVFSSVLWMSPKKHQQERFWHLA